MTRNVGLLCALLTACGGPAEGVHQTSEPPGSEPAASEPPSEATGAAEPPSEPVGVAAPMPSEAAVDCEQAVFASPAIEADLRRELAFTLEDDGYLTRPGPFSQQELSLVTSVVVMDEPVNSLDGLQCLPNLGLLSVFAGGKVSSLEPLRPLAQLTKVSLADMQITDLTPLNGMSLLKKLDVSGNPIETLAELELPPGDPECPYLLAVKDTAFGADEVQRFCEQDWYVVWEAGVPDGSCNSQMWNDCNPLK